MRKALAKWLVVFALACIGFVLQSGHASAQDGTTVQGTQSSTDSTAATGNTTGTNNASFTGGPSATGSTGASSQQLGENRAAVAQSGTVKSGDPVAGAQITGAVADNVTVQNQNNADNPSATSGDADMTNDVEALLGPNATSTGGGTAQSHQIGSNELDVSQVSGASTGDAVAGSQVTGIVGDGEHTVQNQNTAVCTDTPCAESFTNDATRSADADNFINASVGPFADSSDTAQTGQIGSNDAIISQSGEAHSGDALFGSQVTGVVGGSATVQNQNSSENNGEGTTARSGGADVDNFVREANYEAIVGPEAFGSNGAPTLAQVSQTGDNTVDVAQAGHASSGDALSGAQVTGGVGDQDGFFTVQNQQASEDDDSVSGDVEVENEFDAHAGPHADASDDGGTAEASLIGDNNVAVAQLAEAGTGDALAGAQVTGAVGYSDVTVQNQNTADGSEASVGEVDNSDSVNDVDTAADVFAGADTASASQIGDNFVSGAQDAVLTTGDAVAGSQVTGVVAPDGATVTVQNQNSGTDIDANPDGGDGEIDIDDDVNTFEADAGPDAESVLGPAQGSQIGDNSFAVAQSAELATGDAVAGSQVTGVVAGDDSEITIQNQNSGTDTDANSGDGAASVDIDEDINDIDLIGGPDVTSQGGTTEASQIGDNSADLSQAASAATGDGVSGAQVTGVVTGDGSTVTVQNANSADNTDVNDASDAAEIDIDDEVNEIDVDLGPVSDGDNSALSTQNGDNSVNASQAFALSTGDAVGGAQVTGVVAGDDSEITIQNQNAASEIDVNDSFDAASIDLDDNGNELDANLGADANVFNVGSASASQIGDNTLVADQVAIASTGDAVGGAQITGTVAGDGSVTTIQNQNSVDDIDVNDGDGAAEIDFDDAVNDIDADLGSEATSTDASLASTIGNTSVTVSQTADLATGDAVGGAQVTGSVSGDNSSTTVQVSNTATNVEVNGGEDAMSIDLDDEVNELDIASGARAFSDSTAEASQIGDNSADVGQSANLSTGDAVGGAQVTGTVSGDNSATTIQSQNSSDGSDVNGGSDAGSIEVDDDVNDADIDLGTDAGSGGTAQSTQNGDNAATLSQDAVLSTGDAVGGAQVTGSVTGDNSVIEIQNQNTANDTSVNQGNDAGGIDINADINDADLNLGPDSGSADGAQSSQIGDNSASVDQTVDASTGDAVGGSQVTGAVAGDGSDVTIQNQNTSDVSDVTTGDIEISGEANDLTVDLGPQAGSGGPASAEQIGDNWLDFSQTAVGATGDAVAGSQVTGVVGPEDAVLQVSNSDTAGVATSGTVDMVNEADGNLSPTADSSGTANAQHTGNSGFDGSQSIDTGSGDAVAGGQVSGVVGSSGGTSSDLAGVAA